MAIYYADLKTLCWLKKQLLLVSIFYDAVSE